MEELFREKLKTFLIGFIAGGIPSGVGLLGIAPGGDSIMELVVEYGVRFLGTIFIALFTGLLTVMMKDFYDIRIKNKFHKMIKVKEEEQIIEKQSEDKDAA